MSNVLVLDSTQQQEELPPLAIPLIRETPPAVVDASVPSLDELASQIKEEHAQVLATFRSGLQHARRAGDLLILAKQQISHGGWEPWVEANCTFSKRTAETYMRIAGHWPEIEANPQFVADMPINAAQSLIAKPKRSHEAKKKQPGQEQEQQAAGKTGDALALAEGDAKTEAERADEQLVQKPLLPANPKDRGDIDQKRGSGSDQQEHPLQEFWDALDAAGSWLDDIVQSDLEVPADCIDDAIERLGELKASIEQTIAVLQPVVA